MKLFNIERDGQEYFYKQYLPLINKELKENDILLYDTDGVVNGNLLEFKLNINDLNKVLFQAIKYLSKMRIKGEPVPKNILLISLNTYTAFLYDSNDYLEWIEKQYFGGASTNNEGFASKDYLEKINYNTDQGSYRMLELLREDKYTKIHIDETCIVGWAKKYYREVAGSNKGDFIGDNENNIQTIGEIRNPIVFKEYIYPYRGETNLKFQYLLDKLNDKITQKETGAFYTPTEYAKKAAELVLKAIERVPEGNDYVIFDFCAGTGNLEEVLPDDVLSRCILSTYEYYEYRVLLENLGDKVKYIIPPTESQVEYSNGFITNADALSEKFISNPVIKKHIDDPKMTIIMYENPPYRDQLSDNSKKSDRAKVKDGFIVNEMKKELQRYRVSSIATARDLSNQFIFRTFKYYLRQDTDSYILFSPLKYWKTIGITQNKKYIDGFLFNRKHFHATPSAISCILWGNNKVKNQTEIKLKVFDIEKNEPKFIKEVSHKEVYNSFSNLYFDFREFPNDIETEVFCEANGYETNGRKTTGKSYYNSNILAYLRTTALAINSQQRYLTRQKIFNAAGFYLRTDNYKEKLPLFVAKLFPQDNWYEKDVYFTTSDGKYEYTNDNEFLKQCLIYTCLTNQNKCISFNGSDGRLYRNELSFDSNTIAKKDLDKYILNNNEKEIISIWEKIIEFSKKTKKYNKDFTYGVYQIEQELNTFILDDNNKRIYDYPELNGDLQTLKRKLKDYYIKYIRENMFKYGLIK